MIFIKKKTVRDENSTYGRCEDCVYYDYDELLEESVCTLSLDEDEMVSFLSRKKNGCPYFKFYDEYKLVRHQN